LMVLLPFFSDIFFGEFRSAYDKAIRLIKGPPFPRVTLFLLAGTEGVVDPLTFFRLSPNLNSRLQPAARFPAVFSHLFESTPCTADSFEFPTHSFLSLSTHWFVSVLRFRLLLPRNLVFCHPIRGRSLPSFYFLNTQTVNWLRRFPPILSPPHSLKSHKSRVSHYFFLLVPPLMSS